MTPRRLTHWLLILTSTLVASACGSSSESEPQAIAGASSAGTAGTGVSAGAGNAGSPSAGSAGAGLGGASAGSGGGAGSGGAPATGGASGAAGGTSGTGGTSASYVLPAYTSNAASISTNLGTRNAGHQFEVLDHPVRIRDLGVWDSAADGLVQAHTVTLFSIDKLGAGAKGTPLAGGSTRVPAGKAGAFEAGFRYAPLPAPLDLEPGKYAVVAYGLNQDDLPGDGAGLPLPLTGVRDGNFDVYQFVDAASPAFPNGGDASGHSNASFRFDSQVKPLRIMPWGASITDGYLGTKAGYRGPLRDLLDAAHVPFQYVGSGVDNPGTNPLPREQRHHEGHSGFVIQAGAGRAGIWNSREQWLGPMGSQADLFLIVIGTNDVDLNYQLDKASTRLDALVSSVLDPKTGLQPNARVILAQLPPINDAAEDARCLTYNQAIVSVVEAHRKKGEAISTVDLHAVVQKSELADKLHPNDVGYAKIAKVWFDAIQALYPPKD